MRVCPAKSWRRGPVVPSVTGGPILSGFTLIELVISTSLTAIILIGAYACLRGGFASETLIANRAQAAQGARVALSLIAADLRSATRLSKDYEFLGMSRMLGDVEADNVDFATRHYTPRAAREGDFCEVSYYLDKRKETGSYSIWRRRDPTPDPEPLSGGSREEIAGDVLGLRFEFYDGFEWFDDWGDADGRRQQSGSLLDPGNLSGMPDAVRITIWAATDSAPVADDPDGVGNREPPLVFQTITRLNVTALDSPGAGTSSVSATQNSLSPEPSNPQERP